MGTAEFLEENQEIIVTRTTWVTVRLGDTCEPGRYPEGLSQGEKLGGVCKEYWSGLEADGRGDEDGGFEL